MLSSIHGSKEQKKFQNKNSGYKKTNKNLRKITRSLLLNYLEIYFSGLTEELVLPNLGLLFKYDDKPENEQKGFIFSVGSKYQMKYYRKALSKIYYPENLKIRNCEEIIRK